MDKVDIRSDLVAILVDTYYGWQEPRKAFYNSARNLVRRKIEDLSMRVPEEKKEDKAYINRYIDSNLESLLEEIAGGDITEFEMRYISGFIKSGKALKDQEKRAQVMMGEYLVSEKAWAWLKKIRGISNVLAINLIREFDFRKAKHVSGFWKYAGLHVTDEGVAPRRKKGEVAGYNVEAKTLMWKIASSFVKQRTEPYRDMYDEEKERQLNKEYPVGHLSQKYPQKRKVKDKKTGKISLFPIYPEDATQLIQGHAHNRALRYIAKEFLKDYYIHLCSLHGVTPDEPYSARFHPGENEINRIVDWVIEEDRKLISDPL